LGLLCKHPGGNQPNGNHIKIMKTLTIFATALANIDPTLKGFALSPVDPDPGIDAARTVGTGYAYPLTLEVPDSWSVGKTNGDEDCIFDGETALSLSWRHTKGEVVWWPACLTKDEAITQGACGSVKAQKLEDVVKSAAAVLGSIKSDAKAAAARTNGAKGGRPSLYLTQALFSTGITATGKETTEGTLEAGARIRAITEGVDSAGQPVWTFQASTDGGKTWFKERSHERPVVESR